MSQADVSAIKLEVLPDKGLPKNGPGRAKNGNFVLEQFLIEGHLAYFGNNRLPSTRI
jgi:hypothetical protein